MSARDMTKAQLAAALARHGIVPRGDIDSPHCWYRNEATGTEWQARGRGTNRRNRLANLLRDREILEWARRYHRSTGRWPTHRSGPVHGTRELKWSSIEYALRLGGRGLPGGTTLARLLDKHIRG